MVVIGIIIKHITNNILEGNICSKNNQEKKTISHVHLHPSTNGVATRMGGENMISGQSLSQAGREARGVVH